jgi:hypothetical protein
MFLIWKRLECFWSCTAQDRQPLHQHFAIKVMVAGYLFRFDIIDDWPGSSRQILLRDLPGTEQDDWLRSERPRALLFDR